MFTFDQKLEALSREIRLRRRVYPKWVSAGKLTQEKADFEVAIMKAILADIYKAKLLREAGEEMLKNWPKEPEPQAKETP